MTVVAGPTVGVARDARLPWQAKYLLLALIWGSSFLFMKVGLAALQPLQIATLRIYSGAAVLLVLLRVTRGRLPRDRRVWGHLAVSSTFLAVLPFTGFVVGETRTDSALAGIANAVTPISAVLFGLALLPSERLTPRKLGAVVIGFVGVVAIAEPWNVAGRPDPVGLAILLAAGCCYGLGWTYNRRFLGTADLGGLSQPTALLLAASVLMTPVFLGWWLLHREGAPAPWSLVDAAVGRVASGPAGDVVVGEVVASAGERAYPVWLAVLCVVALGVVGTGLAYMLQYDVVREAGAIVSTTVTYLIPVVSVLLGVLVLGERLGVAQFAGFAIVLAAALVINRPARRSVAG